MRHLLTGLTMLMMTVHLCAQGRGELIQERVEAQRVAFITQRLELTPDESAKFWPIYNAYRDEQQKLRKDAFPDRRLKDLSDAEAEKVIADHFEMEEKLLALKRTYYGKMKTAIPPSKIAQLVPAEMEFNRQVLERLRERRGG